MTQLVEGGRPITRFRVFGFPVTIDISFVVIVALLGWYPGVPARNYVVWLVLVPVAVLVHELGHAFVARTTGAAPTIALVGLGGLTSYLPPAPPSRARSISISVAGPAVGIVIGLGLLGYARGVGTDSDLVATVLNIAVFTTLGWGLLNLLPILPLDGGQTLRELLPGSPAKREVRAASVSVVVAALAAVVAYRAGLVFGAVMALFFIASNVMTVRQARELAKVDVNHRLVALLWAGRRAEADDLLADQPQDGAVHPLVRATVLAAGEGGAGAARRELEAAAAQQPAAGNLLLLVHSVRADWPAALALVGAAGGPTVDSSAVVAAQAVAVRAGAVRESAQLGAAHLDRPGEIPGTRDRDERSVVAFNTARAWSATGEPGRGLAAFQQAADLGFDDLTAVDAEPDLGPLRPMAGYDVARTEIRRRALQRTERDD